MLKNSESFSKKVRDVIHSINENDTKSSIAAKLSAVFDESAISDQKLNVIKLQLDTNTISVHGKDEYISALTEIALRKIPENKNTISVNVDPKYQKMPKEQAREQIRLEIIDSAQREHITAKELEMPLEQLILSQGENSEPVNFGNPVPTIDLLTDMVLKGTNKENVHEILKIIAQAKEQSSPVQLNEEPEISDTIRKNMQKYGIKDINDYEDAMKELADMGLLEPETPAEEISQESSAELIEGEITDEMRENMELYGIENIADYAEAMEEIERMGIMQKSLDGPDLDTTGEN